MELDGRSLGRRVLETDVCVIGAGPAGLAFAQAFVGGQTDVLLLESGGVASEPSAQELNEGRTVGDPYVGLRSTRHRQIGGSANTWHPIFYDRPGAKYTPLEPSDVEAPSDDTSGDWPLRWSELERWYEHAQAVCGLGRFDYRAPAKADGAFDLSDCALENRVYQLGPASVFTRAWPDAVLASSGLRLCHHATVCSLHANRAGTVEEARVAAPGGGRFTIRAQTFVLAAGAVENARLLLLSTRCERSGLRISREWIGRCFMEHPRDYGLTVSARPGLLEHIGFYDSHIGSDGTTVRGRIAPTQEALIAERLPSASVTVVPRPRAGRAHALGLEDHGLPRFGSTWSTFKRHREAFDGLRFVLNVEQRPHSDNRVTLGERRDYFGNPAPELRWRWHAEDQGRLERLQRFVVREASMAGLGRVEVVPAPIDPNAHHHSGTTRMSRDETSGVVDSTGRVHGTANLFITGASVLPRSGFANSTLTIVALTLRLATHLGARLPNLDAPPFLTYPSANPGPGVLRRQTSHQPTEGR